MTRQNDVSMAQSTQGSDVHLEALKAYTHVMELKTKIFACYSQAHALGERAHRCFPEEVALLMEWAKALMYAHALYRFEDINTYERLRSLGARVHAQAYCLDPEKACQAWSEGEIPSDSEGIDALLVSLEETLCQMRRRPLIQIEDYIARMRTLNTQGSLLYRKWANALKEALHTFEQACALLSESPKAQSAWGDLWCEQALHMQLNQQHEACFERAFEHYQALYILSPSAFYCGLALSSFPPPTLVCNRGDMRMGYVNTYRSWRQTCVGQAPNLWDFTSLVDA